MTRLVAAAQRGTFWAQRGRRRRGVSSLHSCLRHIMRQVLLLPLLLPQ